MYINLPFLFKIYREPELCELFSNFFTVNQNFLVHIILVHRNLNKKLKLLIKNGREPELCEPELCEPFFQ